MRCIPKFVGAAFLVLMLVAAPGRSSAQGSDSAALRRTFTEFARLRADLDKINAEVADLKRSDRSVRNDYRLRDRLADAEALAQKVTQTEARLRALGWTGGAVADTGPRVAPPQALPQDGTVELEAKAGLFADQARKLDGEAGVLSKAADELRSRRALHRRESAFDRDPFSGLESSKRSLAVSVPTPKATLSGSSGADSTTRGGTGTNGSQAPSGGGPTFAAPSGSTGTSTPIALSPTAAITDSAGKEAAPSVAPEAAASSKTSPLTQTAGLDRQSFEQRLYLDPATAAELRHVLGAAGATSDPEALDRAAATLRVRARALNAQAQSLLAKSRAP
jgi:hypothetical protein